MQIVSFQQETGTFCNFTQRFYFRCTNINILIYNVNLAISPYTHRWGSSALLVYFVIHKIYYNVTIISQIILKSSNNINSIFIFMDKLLHESEYGGAQYWFSRMFIDFSSSSALNSQCSNFQFHEGIAQHVTKMQLHVSLIYSQQGLNLACSLPSFFTVQFSRANSFILRLILQRANATQQSTLGQTTSSNHDQEL